MAERIRAPAVAKIIGYTTRHVLRLAQAGLIPSAAQPVPGGSWTFREAAIRDWLASKEQEVVQRNKAARRQNSTPGSIDTWGRDKEIEEAYHQLIGKKPAIPADGTTKKRHPRAAKPAGSDR